MTTITGVAPASGYAAQIDRNMKHLAAALPGAGPEE